MRSVEEALGAILEGLAPLPAERVPLAQSLGRVLAEPVRTPVDVPPFASSSMDGYAVRAADVPGTLAIVGEVRAGEARLPAVGPVTAARIMTGAPLPPGADAVVPLERAEERNGVVIVGGEVAAGAFVRPRADDSWAGETVLAAGSEVTPAAIAVAASCGLDALPVRRRPRVAIVSTGDELTAPGAPLSPSAIYDANGPGLAAAVREAGGEPLVLPRTADRLADVEAVLRTAAAESDLVITSGGVSVGRHDVVRAAIERSGRLEFWRIAVQPGKPLAYGRLLDRPVLGLPGNPVSALVTFELFARPVIRALLGLAGDGRLRLRATLRERIAKDRERRAYLRVLVRACDGEYEARSAGGQSSGQLRPLATANALLVVPEGADAAEPGATYEAIVVGPLA